MAPKNFPYIKDGSVGDVPIGFFPAPDSERGEILKRTWGLLEHSAITDCSEGRGIYSWDGVLYCVFRMGSTSVLYQIDPVTGTYIGLGTITTSFTGPVWMKNNPTQLAISDGVTMYIYTPATGSFVANSDPDFPGSTAIDYQDGLGLYVVPNSNQWAFTGLYDFGSIDALDFYSFESRTGNILSLISFMREVYVLGQNGSEVWYFAGGDNSSADNPTFARNTAGTIEYGCGAVGTPNTADGTIVNWLSNQGQVVAAAGYNAKPVSNQMMEDAIKAMPTYADALAYSFRDGGHVFTVYVFPAGQQTWVIDWTTKAIFRMQSFTDDLTNWSRHRLNCVCKLNNILFGLDYSNGKVYKMSLDYYDDDGHAIRRELDTVDFDGGRGEIDFGPMSLLMKMGIGLESGLDPQVMMSYSRDSGETWSATMWRSAGKIGEMKRPCPRWNRNGQSKKRMFKFAFTDAVAWEIWGLDLPMQRLEG